MAVATGLSAIPAFAAIALSVVVRVTAIEPVYRFDDAVGVLPSVV